MSDNDLEKATFAGGCFWCMQGPFDVLDGVISTVVGYTGGTEKNPSYEQISTGTTGHAEAIEITFDPKKITYQDLLDVFWRNIDPTTRNRQFADQGSQYRTAIFYHNNQQRHLAEDSKRALSQSGKFNKPIVTEIVPADIFFRAEDYHQHYYRENALHYNMYKNASGRASFILCYFFEVIVLSFQRFLKRNPGFDPGSTMSRKATGVASWLTSRLTHRDINQATASSGGT